MIGPYLKGKKSSKPNSHVFQRVTHRLIDGGGLSDGRDRRIGAKKKKRKSVGCRGYAGLKKLFSQRIFPSLLLLTFPAQPDHKRLPKRRMMMTHVLRRILPHHFAAVSGADN